MNINDLLTSDRVLVIENCTSKKEALDKAADMIGQSGAVTDSDAFRKGIDKREQEFSTNVGGGIAIPHCKSEVVKEPALAAITFKEAIEYDDGDKVDLLFMIAAPKSKDNIHLDVLARLSQMLMHKEFKEDLMKANTSEEFVKIVADSESSWLEGDKSSSKNQEANKISQEEKKDLKEKTTKEDAANNKKSEESPKENNSKTPTLLAVTSCPTGIAHTYMAQEALENQAKEIGVSIKVETNGSGGAKNVLTDEEIENAKCIIVAADAFVEMSRFNGKKVLECPVSDAIKGADKLIDTALNGDVPVYGSGQERKKVEMAEHQKVIHCINT